MFRHEDHVAARWVGIAALATSVAWIGAGVGIVAWGVGLSRTDGTAAPPLGLALVLVVALAVIAVGTWAAILSVRVERGIPGAARRAQRWFAVMLLVAIVVTPVAIGDASLQPPELALIAISAIPTIALALDGLITSSSARR